MVNGPDKIGEQQNATDAMHVAIIMDGNGRWAKKRKLPRHAGHRAGVKAARRVVEACPALGIRTLTLFAFSSENWGRPKEEVQKLMALFIEALNKQVPELNEQGVKLTVIGDRQRYRILLQGHRPCPRLRGKSCSSAERSPGRAAASRSSRVRG